MIECMGLSIVKGWSDQLSTHPRERQRKTGGGGFVFVRYLMLNRIRYQANWCPDLRLKNA